jgi:excisionase family DNA binding protein
MSDDLLTTTEAARLAGVGASSVKRWADQNLIRCVKTAGGHRRILRGDLERFLREHGGVPGAGSSEEWADLFLTTGVFEMQGEILRSRERLGAWYLVGEEIGGGLTEIGLRWERGEITVLEEHVASERLARAIGRAVESIPSSAAGPRALLATAEGDNHTLGLSLAELCLRECGWNVVWTGRETPLSREAGKARREGVQHRRCGAGSRRARGLARKAGLRDSRLRPWDLASLGQRLADEPIALNERGNDRTRTRLRDALERGRVSSECSQS